MSRALWTVEIRVPLKGSYATDTDQPTIAKIEEKCFELACLGKAEYTGILTGPEEVILTFETSSPVQLLDAMHRLLPASEVPRGTYVLLTEADDVSSSLQVPLDEIPSWLAQHSEVLGRSPAKKMPRVRPRVGDYYAFELPDGRIAYGWHIYSSAAVGDVVQVLDIFSNQQPIDVRELSQAGPLFPPVAVFLRYAIKDGSWKKIGHKSPEASASPPVFRKSWKALLSAGPGEFDDWQVGNEDIGFTYVGVLNAELRLLEHSCIWSGRALADRIVTGRNDDERLR